MKPALLGLRWLPVVVALGATACPAAGPDPTEPGPHVDAGLPGGKADVVSVEAPAGPPDAAVADTTSVADTAGAIADPGKPSKLFGPKCWGHFGFMQNGLFNQDFPVDCTAYAHSTAAGSHLFLEFAGLGNVATAYASVLLPITPWRPGLYSTALAGRYEVMLKDGRRYRTSIYAAPGGSGDLAEMTLQVDTVSDVQPGEPSHYIKGSIEAELRPVPGSGATDSLFMRIQIDTPAPSGPQPILQLDCRPRLPGAVDFRTSCNLSQRNGTPYAYCRQYGGSGGFGIHVLQPDKVKVGEVIAIGGASPIVRVDGQFTTRNSKPPMVEGSDTGYFLIHELVPDKVLRGRFINATVGLGPQPVQTCRFGETTFEATPGG